MAKPIRLKEKWQEVCVYKYYLIVKVIEVAYTLAESRLGLTVGG